MWLPRKLDQQTGQGNFIADALSWEKSAGLKKYECLPASVSQYAVDLSHSHSHPEALARLIFLGYPELWDLLRLFV